MFPTIKQYNIDYDFLISNYLNKELWKKKWNLFVYKDNVFTLNLYKIYTQTDSIVFEIKYNKLQYSSQEITYYLNNTSLQVLKQQINGAIFRLMESYDNELCRKTKGYKDICDMYDDEYNTLKDVAEEYLDSCGVTHEDIRDAYIDRYISDNQRCDVHKQNYLYGHRYEQLTDMFLVFTKITNDANRYRTVVEAINDGAYIKKIETQLKEFKEYFGTEEYTEEMNDNLISI